MTFSKITLYSWNLYFPENIFNRNNLSPQLKLKIQNPVRESTVCLLRNCRTKNLNLTALSTHPPRKQHKSARFNTQQPYISKEREWSRRKKKLETYKKKHSMKAIIRDSKFSTHLVAFPTSFSGTKQRGGRKNINFRTKKEEMHRKYQREKVSRELERLQLWNDFRPCRGREWTKTPILRRCFPLCLTLWKIDKYRAGMVGPDVSRVWSDVCLPFKPFRFSFTLFFSTKF